MMLTGWVAFLGAWLMNLLFYKVHPSSVEFSYKEKLFIHILGRKRFLCGYRDPKAKGRSDKIQMNKAKVIK